MALLLPLPSDEEVLKMPVIFTSANTSRHVTSHFPAQTKNESKKKKGEEKKGGEGGESPVDGETGVKAQAEARVMVV